MAIDVCFGKDEEDVRRLIFEMGELAPELIGYLTDHITPHLERFAACFRGSAFTLGYLATSPAESVNHMIREKLTARKIGLSAMRQIITNVFERKGETVAGEQTMPVEMVDILRPLRPYLGPVIMQQLVTYIVLSKKFDLEIIDDVIYIKQVHANQEKRDLHFVVTEDSCQCGILASTGLPCPHLICAYHFLASDQFPVFLINPRWFSDGCGPPSETLHLIWRPFETLVEQTIHCTEEDDGDPEFTLSDDSEEDSAEDDSSEFTLPVPDADDAVPHACVPQTEDERFRELSIRAKEIARLACKDRDAFTMVVSDMDHISTKLVEMGITAGAAATTDFVVKNKRGRPRKEGFSKQKARDCHKQKCILCKQAHDWQQCIHANLLRNLMPHGDITSDITKCLFCGGKQHDPGKCSTVKVVIRAIKHH
jgi:hypothetical protein